MQIIMMVSLFPSISTIAKSAMCGVTTVKKYIKKLSGKRLYY